MTLRIFIGYDDRQPLSYQVLHHSIVARASEPVAITPLVLKTLPIVRRGLTPFTFTRFLVPHLCGFKGKGLFLDADMIALGDIADIFAAAKGDKAVWIVDTAAKFERASLMLFDCGHPANAVLSPQFVEKADKLHVIAWLDDSLIGLLPSEWNHCVFYDAERKGAKLVHYTAGIPAYPETRGCEYTGEYLKELETANSMIPWWDLMGQSVHVGKVLDFQKRRDGGKLAAV